jgi:predicted XRE-type DNA-binding protein
MVSKVNTKTKQTAATARSGKPDAVDAGSGNVFTDLGFADSDERRLRVQLAMQLNELITARPLTQAQVSALFGIPQPHVSELRNYKLTRFSAERLMRFLTLLDRDVQIVIRPKAHGRAAGSVSMLVSLGINGQRNDSRNKAVQSGKRNLFAELEEGVVALAAARQGKRALRKSVKPTLAVEQSVNKARLRRA